MKRRPVKTIFISVENQGGFKAQYYKTIVFSDVLSPESFVNVSLCFKSIQSITCMANIYKNPLNQPSVLLLFLSLSEEWNKTQSSAEFETDMSTNCHWHILLKMLIFKNSHLCIMPNVCYRWRIRRCFVLFCFFGTEKHLFINMWCWKQSISEANIVTTFQLLWANHYM